MTTEREYVQFQQREMIRIIEECLRSMVGDDAGVGFSDTEITELQRQFAVRRLALFSIPPLVSGDTR